LVLAAAVLPAAEFSTYIGDQNTWHIAKVIVDASGNTYVAGSRAFNLSMSPVQPNFPSEAIVAKLDNAGKVVLFAALGGKGSEAANDVALDRGGNIYIAGSTTSPNFPVHNALFPAAGRGFLAKFSPDGSEVIYATYFPERIEGLAVDAAGAVYVTGTTFSPGFPVTAGLPAGPVSSGASSLQSGAFLTKISAGGDRLVYSTIVSGRQKNCTGGSSCFLSSRGASGVGVGVDAAGNAYFAGNSDVSDLPVTAGALRTDGVGAFVAKVNAAGTAMVYLTYLGADGHPGPSFFNAANTIRALAVDAVGNAYVSGSTFDPKLPVTAGAFQTAFQGGNDAFALELNPTGTAAVWGSYLGGGADDYATASALDSAGNLWVAGSSNSTAFPNVNGWSTGGDFIVRFNPTGGLSYSARYPGGTASQTLAVDTAGLLRVGSPGGVVSAISAVAKPLMRPWSVGLTGGQIAPSEVISIFGPHIGGAPVSINGIAAPILYAGDDQINIVVPFEIEGQKTARVQVGASPEFAVAVLPAIPQIFSPALNQDGTVNSPDNPARVGSVMSIWVTGFGAVAVPDGRIATGPQQFGVGLLYAGSTSVRTLYTGAAPGLIAGVAQINFVVPDFAAAVSLAVGPYESAPLTIYVTP
jgi:uncharacterized protein (TIGR03437 family)